MKNSLFPLSVLALLLAQPTVAEDEYDYIETPVPSQIADLADDDNDGVINARDKCITTPEGAEVDNYGCETLLASSEALELKVFFTNDSYQIAPAFINQIKAMVEFLKSYPDVSIEIQGYASRVGSSEHNLMLSEKRAREVEKTILRQGISADRVTIVGFGDTIIEQTGNEEVDHALNRRVVASVVGYDESFIKEWHIFTKRHK